MQNRKKMFVTDLDGTLFTDEKMIRKKDLAALTSLGRQGIIRVFATGRSIYSFQKAVRHLGFSPTGGDMPVDYVIFSTGAGIMECTHGEIIKKKSLASTDVRQISAYFDSLGLDYMIHRPVPDTRYFVYKTGGHGTGEVSGSGQGSTHKGIGQISGRWGADGHAVVATGSAVNDIRQSCREDVRNKKHAERLKNPDFHARIALYRQFGRPMGRKDGSNFGESTEILAIVPPCCGHEVADTVHRDLREFSVIKATSPLDGESTWIEVFHPLVSKSKSVAWLAARLGIRRTHVISVGNDYNDLDLLEWSGQGFIVANAPEDIRKRFEVVASNNRCGVAQVICNNIIDG